MFIKFVALWQKWGGKAGLSIFDQIVFSGANFGLNILLARWLTPKEYGTFVIVFSIFLFLSSFYQALIFEPMSVIGSSRYKDRLNIYLGVTLWIYTGLSLIFSLLLSLIAVFIVVKDNLFFPSFLGLVISTPLILFFWFFRQVCYLYMNPKIALKGSIIYTVVLVVGLIGCYRQHWLSPFSALLIMAISSLVAALIFFSSFSIERISIYRKREKIIIKEIFIENWRYGKWVTGSAFVNWLSTVVYLPMVGVIVGSSQAGVFKAMSNLVLPIQRIFSTFGLLLLPWLSKQRTIEGLVSLKRKLSKFAIANILLSTSYFLILLLWGKDLLRFFYGEGYYIQFTWLLPYLGCITIVESLAHVLYIGLKALEKSDAVFWSQTAGVVFTLTFGLYMVVRLKLYGAALGSLLSILSITVMLLIFIRSQLKAEDNVICAE